MSFFDDLGEADQAAPEPEPRERLGGRAVALVVGGVMLILAAVYVALAALASDTAPRGVSVEGVSVGAQSPEAAAHTLQQRLAPRLEVPVKFSHAGRTFALVPREVGVSIDYDATVRAAGAVAGWSPRRLWDWVSRSDDTDVVLRFDDVKWSAALSAITRQLREQAVEGSIDFSTGKAVPVFGREGLRVDRKATAADLHVAMFRPRTMTLSLQRSEPYISREAVRKAMTDFGEPAMSAPVVIRIGTAHVIAPPGVVGRALTMIPSGRELRPVVNGKRLMALLKPRMKTVGSRPRDASVKVVGGRLVVTPAVIGAVWDDAELSEGLPAVLTRPVGSREFTLKAAVQQPKRTDAAIAKWGIKQRVQGFRVRVGGPDAPTRVAVDALDNLLLPPGATLSFLDVASGAGLGPQAPAVAGAIFNAAWQLGLLDVQHTQANVRDPRFPVGREITVGPTADLKIGNNTPHSILISATVEGGILNVGLWTTPFHRVGITTSKPFNLMQPVTRYSASPKCRPKRGAVGYSVSVTRSGGGGGQLLSTYPSKPAVIC